MKKILILISIGLLLLNGCGKKPTRYQLENYDESKTISPKKDNKLHGITKRYYGNGKIYQEISYINGKRTGVHCTYTIAGDLMDYETYKDDVLNGLSKKYHYLSNNKTKLKSKVIYKNGKKNGLETIYYENGKVKSKTSYKDGKKNGISYSYNKNGDEIGIETYKNNERNGLCTYLYPYQQKVKKVVSHYKNDKKEGISISYYSDGTVSSTENYQDGKQHGKSIGYYPNGEIKYVSSYENGKKSVNYGISYKKDGSVDKEATNKNRLYYERWSTPTKKTLPTKTPKKVSIVKLKCKSSLGSSSLSISEFSREKAKATGSGKGSALGYLMNHRQPSKINAYQYCTEEANSKIRVENTTCSMAKIFRTSCMNGFGY